MQLVSLSCLHLLVLSQTFSAALASPRAWTATAAVRPPGVQTFHPLASLGPLSVLLPAAWAARCQQQAWRACRLTPAASAWRTGEHYQPALAHLHADLWLTCLVLNLHPCSCNKMCVRFDLFVHFTEPAAGHCVVCSVCCGRYRAAAALWELDYNELDFIRCADAGVLEQQQRWSSGEERQEQQLFGWAGRKLLAPPCACAGKSERAALVRYCWPTSEALRLLSSVCVGLRPWRKAHPRRPSSQC